MRKSLAAVALAALLITPATALAIAGPAMADDTASTQEVASSPSTQDQSPTSTEPTSEAPADPASSPETPTSEPAAPASDESPADPAPATPSTADGQPGDPASSPSSSAPEYSTQPAAEPTPVEGWWIMPNGGTADNVTWPQTATPAGVIPCGTTAQVDLYPSQQVLDGLAADGVLEQGEDYSTVISWRFVAGDECPPAPGPANPGSSIDQVCGLATVHATNDGDNLLTASIVIYLDGDFLTALAVPAGETIDTPIGVAEDSGDHTVVVRTGPAFGDVELATATIDSDCEPAVVVPPVTTPPTTTPTPTPQTAPVVPAAAITPASADVLASTGTDIGGLVLIGLAAFILGGIIAVAVRVYERRSPRYRRNRA